MKRIELYSKADIIISNKVNKSSIITERAGNIAYLTTN